jgi:hypothetical protein
MVETLALLALDNHLQLTAPTLPCASCLPSEAWAAVP